jgi:hypothetical protein
MIVRDLLLTSGDKRVSTRAYSVIPYTNDERNPNVSSCDLSTPAMHGVAWTQSPDLCSPPKCIAVIINLHIDRASASPTAREESNSYPDR